MTDNKKWLSRDLWLSILLIAIILMISGFTYVQGDLTTYIATPMAIADQEIFTNDFSIQAFKGANPQSVSDNFLALFMKMGISWQMISIVGFLITFIIFAAGIIAIAREITGGKNYWLVSGLLMLFSLYAASGLRIGRNPIWYNSFYYAQMGFCLAVWGFYFSLKKKWYTAFILFGIATLLHFTVGCYSAGFMVLFLLYDVFKHKKFKQLPALLIWVACAVGIYIMVALAGSIDTGLLSNEAFVKIHCYLRHPHHHIPSSWETSEWINFICYALGTGLFMRIGLQKDEKRKSFMSFFAVTTALTALILIVNYLFIEVVPLAFIGKLQPARSIFIYRFFLAGILAYTIYRLWQQEKYFHAAVATFFITIPRMFEVTFSGILLFMLAFIMLVRMWGARKENKVLTFMCDLALILVIMAVFWLSGSNIFIVVTMFSIMSVLILMAMLTVYLKVSAKAQKHLMAIYFVIVACFVLIMPWVDVQGRFEHFGIKSFENRFTLCDVSLDAKTLALRFKENTPKDTTFFGDPYDITSSYFRLFSERSQVVAFKNMPFTDQGLIEWVDRLSKMGGLSVNDAGYYVKHPKAFKQMTPEDMITYARSYGASYLLVSFSSEKMDAYLDTGCTLYDREGAWSILALPAD